MQRDNINLGTSPEFYNPSKISEDNLDTSFKSTIHQKPAACTPVFWYLESKIWPDSCLQPKAMFCGLTSHCAEQARCESPMAILRVNLAKRYTALSERPHGLFWQRMYEAINIGDELMYNMNYKKSSYMPTKKPRYTVTVDEGLLKKNWWFSLWKSLQKPFCRYIKFIPMGIEDLQRRQEAAKEAQKNRPSKEDA